MCEIWSKLTIKVRSSRPEMFCKKGIFKNSHENTKQNSQENTCARDHFLIKLQTEAEFCEIFKNTPFYRTPPMAALERHQNDDVFIVNFEQSSNFALPADLLKGRLMLI